jgi:hypothetical protein
MVRLLKSFLDLSLRAAASELWKRYIESSARSLHAREGVIQELLNLGQGMFALRTKQSAGANGSAELLTPFAALHKSGSYRRLICRALADA